ncbi:MAG TPA: hypothetical protein VGC04_04290 [Cellulomonas sp.]
MRPNRRAFLTASCTAILALSATAAQAAPVAAATAVVPVSGSIAGHGYGYWLGAWWKRVLSSPPSTSACPATTAAGPVALPLGGFSNRPETYHCALPAGTAIYVPQLSAECTAPIKGGVDACARKAFAGSTAMSVTLDGRTVPHLTRYATASPTFSFTAPKHGNLLGATQRHGRAAAYGIGLLLRPLPAGQHTITVKGTATHLHLDVTYHIRIR